MIQTKTDYILRSLRKLSHKTWELFIITRILHELDDDEIEFVTQQLVRRPDASRALTDLYFPQLDLHLEIDEPFHNYQLRTDQLREQDIVLITGHRIERIKVLDEAGQQKPLHRIRFEVDNFVSLIKKLKESQIKKAHFIAWDWDKKFSSVPIIERGYLDVEDNVTFRKQTEAMRCFGFIGKGYQRGDWPIPDGTHDRIWFPRLFEHFIWHNELTADGKYIFERALNDEGVRSIAKQLKDAEAHPERKIIVFAKAKDPLGANLLRYVGTFVINIYASTKWEIRFDLIRSREPIRVGYQRN
ncbi:hypothetical protein E8Q33_12250 [Methylophaga sp. SB9B]|uniref:AbaSI family restriction endonuclease n=1 Tax=Methylophaga sp. SB9B TaxID=2570356 RepID=UPI0010A81CA5|nr:hypothetical protein [Methylophaga sp. SB9B]THK40631.1 hypothetical protein E8Q33_12250 [Methylophaga sp. SB9B]